MTIWKALSMEHISAFEKFLWLFYLEILNEVKTTLREVIILQIVLITLLSADRSASADYSV